MVFVRKAALIVGLLPTVLTATEYSSPIENVEVYQTDLSTLAIQNLSNEKVVIDLYGDVLELPAVSGIKYECLGYKKFELQIKYNDHEYFEVPCQSRVIITEAFINQYIQMD